MFLYIIAYFTYSGLILKYNKTLKTKSLKNGKKPFIQVSVLIGKIVWYCFRQDGKTFSFKRQDSVIDLILTVSLFYF